jgi:PadR family transcriptional regulator, regulatory protein AphA
MTPAARASDLSPEHVLLGLLAERPAHGYELHQRLTADLGGLWHLSQSQVYATLKRLEARGWIAGTLHTQPNLPDRRLLRLTTEGRRRFQDWLHAPTSNSVRAIRVEFLTRLFFAGETDSALQLQLISEQAEAVVEGLRRLDAGHLRPSASVITDLAHDLRVRQLASVLPWLDECRRRLIEG